MGSGNGNFCILPCPPSQCRPSRSHGCCARNLRGLRDPQSLEPPQYPAQSEGSQCLRIGVQEDISFCIMFVNIHTNPNRGEITSSRTHQEQQQQDLHLATTEMVTEGMLGVRGEYIGHTSWIASSYQRVFAYHTRPNHTRLHHTSPVQCRLIIRCT